MLEQEEMARLREIAAIKVAVLAIRFINGI
jgi:hypothetical protein